MKKFLTLLAVIFPLLALSQDIPDKPVPQKLVNDFTGFLSKNEVNQLENSLVEFSNQTSTQIAVVILKSLNGYDKSDFAFQLGEKWGIGQKGFNNGIVVLIKPKIGNERGEIFIAIGYGLESVVPDAVTKRIIENEIIPEFKAGNNYAGIYKGVSALMSLTKGEYTAETYLNSTADTERIAGIFVLFFVFLYFIFMIWGKNKNRHHSVGKSLPFWMLMSVLGSSSRSHGGSFGNFSSGGGSFGGFGGGSFGGGGAGGSW